jgi:CRP-like cAMP-binding protein
MTWSAAPGFLELAGEAVAAAVRAQAGRRTFARGEALMHAEQVPREVLLLRSGRVRVSAATPGGRRLLLAFRGPGELVGELSAIDEQPRSASVVALEPVEALVLPGS